MNLKPTFRFFKSQIKATVADAVIADRCGAMEIGGLLIDNGHFIQIVRMRNKSKHSGSFIFYQTELKRMKTAVETLGSKIIGTFHSHPIAPATPGVSDIDGAFSSYMLIIDVMYKKIGFWYIKNKQAYKIKYQLIM